MTSTITPYIRSIWTDVFGTAMNFQQHSRCANYELRVVDCLEAHGVIGGKAKCRILLDDFRECVLSAKQAQRTNIMVVERDRQIKNGEREPGKEYAPPPPKDSF